MQNVRHNKQNVFNKVYKKLAFSMIYDDDDDNDEK